MEKRMETKMKRKTFYLSLVENIYLFEFAYSHPYLSIIFATRNGLRRVASERLRRRPTFHRIEKLKWRKVAIRTKKPQ